MKDFVKKIQRERKGNNMSNFFSTFRFTITHNYIASWWKKKLTENTKTTEMSLQLHLRFLHVIFLWGLKYHKIWNKKANTAWQNQNKMPWQPACSTIINLPECHIEYVGNAPIFTVRKRYALSELDSSLDDANLNRNYLVTSVYLHSFISYDSSQCLCLWQAGGDDGVGRWRVPYGFLPFQTPLCPCAMEREKEGRKEREWRDMWGRHRGERDEKMLSETEGNGPWRQRHRRQACRCIA